MGTGHNDIIKNFYTDLQNYNSDDVYHANNALYFQCWDITDENQLNLLRAINLDEHDIIPFAKAIKNGILFSSCDICINKTNNSFAELNGGTYIKIVNFIIEKDNKREIILYKTFSTRTEQVLSLNNKFLKKISTESEELKHIGIEELINICVLMEVNDSKYICSMPNTILANN